MTKSRRCSTGSAMAEARSNWCMRWRPSRRTLEPGARARPAFLACAAIAPATSAGFVLAARREFYAQGVRLGHQLRGAGGRDHGRSSFATTIPPASIAGSRRWTASRWARSSWSRARSRLRNCGLLLLEKKARPGLGIGRAAGPSSASAFARRGPATHRSRYGPRAILLAARGIYQRAGFSAASPRSRTTVSVVDLIGETWGVEVVILRRRALGLGAAQVLIQPRQ